MFSVLLIDLQALVAVDGSGVEVSGLVTGMKLVNVGVVVLLMCQRVQMRLG